MAAGAFGPEIIVSSSNAGVKRVLACLRDKKARTQHGLFVTEGVRLTCEAPPSLVETVYLSASFRASLEQQGASPGAERFFSEVTCQVNTVSDDLFQKMSDVRTPQGMLALVRMRPLSAEALLSRQTGTPLYLVLEEIHDPGNMGTILRTAEAAGVDGIFLGKGCADLYAPKVVRSTMGAIFRVPFVWADDLTETVNLLQSHDICIYAAHLQGSVPYTEPDYRTGSAFLIGSEARGLSQALTSCADTAVRIPMQGRAESLNAAVSAAILLYEARRQRG